MSLIGSRHGILFSRLMYSIPRSPLYAGPSISIRSENRIHANQPLVHDMVVCHFRISEAATSLCCSRKGREKRDVAAPFPEISRDILHFLQLHLTWVHAAASQLPLSHHNISTCNKHKKCILNNSLPTFDSSLQLSIGMYKLMFEVALGPG